MEKMEIYNRVRSVPDEAKKAISAGRMKGMTDINPMWRIKKLTELFGPCGFGWYYEQKNRWTETVGNETCAFVEIDLYVKSGDEWSKAIHGTGGSKLAAQERSGVYVSDECYKMATTDAISVACKQLGIGADVYFSSDRSKYADKEAANADADKKIAETDIKVLREYFAKHGLSEEKVLKKYKTDKIENLSHRFYLSIINPSNLGYFEQECSK